jgi:hypothetical protein
MSHTPGGPTAWLEPRLMGFDCGLLAWGAAPGSRVVGGCRVVRYLASLMPCDGFSVPVPGRASWEPLVQLGSASMASTSKMSKDTSLRNSAVVVSLALARRCSFPDNVFYQM